MNITQILILIFHIKGIVVYFLYGMRHSKEKAQNAISKVFPLNILNMEVTVKEDDKEIAKF
jgi:hypothetical protein